MASIASNPLVLEVNPSVPAKTVPEFIAYAKANLGKINMASGGNGGPAHVAGELFKMMAGINMVHVPYHGEARFSVVTASARSLPALMYPSDAGMTPNRTCTCPPIRSGL